MPMFDDNTTDVLIVGAGPVGSTLACDLLRRGISFRIIDQKAEPERYSKACNLWQRTQEVFAGIGVLDSLLAESSPLTTFSVHGYGEIAAHIAMDEQPSPHRTPAFLGQNQIERILWEHLDASRHAVERNARVTAVNEGAEHVTVEIEHDGGAGETIKARYLAACDGAKGTIRDMVGLGFAPQMLNQNRLLRQVDARLVRWSRTVQPGHASFFLHDTGYLGVLPIPGGHHRFFLVTDVDQAPAEDRDPTLDEMVALIQTITEDPSVALDDPVWFSRGKYPHGVAPAFRSASGRTFLVGDAGHVTIPIYGQGMNTGIQDAFNLGWKLASVLRDGSPSTLLDTYAEERRAVRATLDAEQTRVWHAIAEPTALQRSLVKWLGSTMMALGPERYFQRRTSQLDIAYPDSPLSLDRLGRSTAKAGSRAPDASVVELPELLTTTLFDQIYRGGWTLLLFDGGDASTHAPIHAFAGLVERRFPSIRALPILSVLDEGRDRLALLDLDRFAHDAYDLDKPTIVLIRPDGYVAFRARPAAETALLDFCDKWMAGDPSEEGLEIQNGRRVKAAGADVVERKMPLASAESTRQAPRR